MFRYKLRTLLIAVTVTGLLLGGRVEYLRRQAAFHDHAAIQSAAMPGGFGGYLYHDEYARNYRAAIVRPWSLVKTPPSAVKGDK